MTDRMTTYEMANGEDICGEYKFVTELEWFEGDDEPTELIAKFWVLEKEIKFTINEPELPRWEAQQSLGGDWFYVRDNSDRLWNISNSHLTKRHAMAIADALNGLEE